MKYETYFWGEMITGTKGELQCFGLGVGRAFPGEPGGPSRCLKLRDTRGFKVEITRIRNGDSIFEARINFEGLPPCPATPRTDEGHGVTLARESWGDVYEGTSEGLRQLGLVAPEHIPGAQGRRRSVVLVLPDGIVFDGIDRDSRKDMIGSRRIEPAGRGRLRVTVAIDAEEAEERRHMMTIRDAAWRHELEARPRPAHLVPMAEHEGRTFAEAARAAKRDTAFQGWLSRLGRA